MSGKPGYTAGRRLLWVVALVSVVAAATTSDAVRADHGAWTVAAATPAAAEGAALRFDLTLELPEPAGVGGHEASVGWVASGTAGPGVDYTPASGTVSATVPEGATSATAEIVLASVQDALDEADETVAVALEGGGSATATIVDDDPAPSVSVSDGEVVEGDAGTTDLSFTIALSAVSGRDVSVGWATQAGSAGTDVDFVGATGTLTIPAGQASGAVAVQVKGDTVAEADETLELNVFTATSATIADGKGIGTIRDDDETPMLAVADAEASEGGGEPIRFRVTLDRPSGQPVSVHYAVAEGTAAAGSDFVPVAAGVLTFDADDAPLEEVVDVPLRDDVLDEDPETLTIALRDAAGATLGDADAVGTIVDDDPEPAVSITDPTVGEPAAGQTATATLTVTLSSVSGRGVTVEWATVDGTATAGADYDAAGGVVAFSPGETAKAIAVAVRGDDVSEEVEEFSVALGNPVNALVSPDAGRAAVTIVDANAPPTVSVDDVVAEEGKGALFLVKKLGSPTTRTVTVPFRTADGTATAGSGDFLARADVVSFAPGEVVKTIGVTVRDDALAEVEETFFLDLHDPSGATLLRARGTARIAASDQVPSTPRGASTPTPTTALPVGTTATRGPLMTLTPRALRVRNGNLAVFRIRCARTATAACAGTLFLHATGKAKKRPLYGRARFSIKPGKSGPVRVRLTKKAASKLRSAKSLRAVASVSVKVGRRTTRATAGVVTLRPAPAKAPKPKKPAGKGGVTVPVP